MLESLPEELLVQILNRLPVPSICQLGATNRHLYQRIQLNEEYWRRRLRMDLRLVIQDHCDSTSTCLMKKNMDGLIHDPNVVTSKEMYLIYCKEFQRGRANLIKKANGGNFIANLFHYFTSEKSVEVHNNSYRLAFFGPGIESRRSKKFIFKMINAHNNGLNATTFVPGLPGGVGSGVRIDFDDRLHTFDLICLYTNTYPLRETFQGQQRLEVGNNRLLKMDGNEEGNMSSLRLNDSMCQLLPTLDGFVFAVDINDETMDFEAVQKELEVMTTADQKPILILCCVENENDFGRFNLDKIAGCFSTMERPWGIFKVNTSTMLGLNPALHWILYSCQKVFQNQ